MGVAVVQNRRARQRQQSLQLPWGDWELGERRLKADTSCKTWSGRPQRPSWDGHAHSLSTEALM